MRSTRRLLTVSALTLSALLTSIATVHGPAVAQSGTVDYHVEAFGDPMDFSNPEDLVIDTNEAMFVGGANRSITGGQLHFDANGPVQFDPVWAGFATAIPHGREGVTHPIDTARYTRFIIRMNAPEGAPVGLRWFNCLKLDASCQGGQAWTAHAGWQTYDIRLGDDGSVPGLPVNWRGSMLGLRFVTTSNGHFDIDYIRLVASDTTDVGEVAGGASRELRPLDRLDYATAAGDPWDMASSSDVGQQVGLRPGATMSGGRFNGCSIGTGTGQFPGLVFRLPGGAIDASTFTTLTFEYGYDAPFSMRPVAGGGRFARVFWTSPDGKRHPTQAIPLYPNEHVAQVRLDDPAAVFQGIEAGKGATGAPWRGSVTSFRLNPNDTRDGACFWIGRVWLTSTSHSATASGGATVASTTPTASAGGATTAPKRTVGRKRTTTRRTTVKRTSGTRSTTK